MPKYTRADPVFAYSHDSGEVVVIPPGTTTELLQKPADYQHSRP